MYSRQDLFPLGWEIHILALINQANQAQRILSDRKMSKTEKRKKYSVQPRNNAVKSCGQFYYKFI